MEVKRECVQFLGEYYKELFFGNVNKRYRAMTRAELEKRLRRLTEESLKPIKKANELSDIRAVLSKIYAYLMRREGNLPPGPTVEEWEKNCASMGELYRALARKDLKYLSDLSLEGLKYVLKMQGIHRYLLANSLERAYQPFHISKTIKKGVRESVSQKPEEEYPGAREMKRRFILHVGPTNSGKTHDALRRLKECDHGAYFGPLRLLTLEVYGGLNAEGLPCSVITGEGTLEVPGSIRQSCTMEMLNDHEYFDVVVVDKCQMVVDPYREHDWTKAVLGPRADEIHLCMAPEAEDIMVQMIKQCDDQCRVVHHKKNTRLAMEFKPYNLKRDPKKGDALIVLSKKSVLALAAHLENKGIHCSVIYGSFSPAARREQVRHFLTKEAEVVVSTDAIGTGLNFPTHGIVPAETRKFDSVNKRTLTPEEIKQIAGRAGRFGLYDERFTSAIDEPEVIRDGLSRLPIPIMKACVRFLKQLLNLSAEIDALVKVWASMDTPSIYERMEMGELLALYMTFEHVHQNDIEDLTRQEIYKLITYSIDIDNKMITDLWGGYCRDYREMGELEFPYSPGDDLYDLESYYKMLDLYFQFSRKAGPSVQTENLAEERYRIEEEIGRIPKTGCASYSHEYSACRKELSWDYPFSVCEKCFKRGKINRAHSRGGRRHSSGTMGHV